MKYVPDATADRGFNEDGTTDRESVDSLLSELDEYAIEQALRIVESGVEAEITYLTVGPDDAKEALRKALAMGGDRAIHVNDDDIAGTDALGTSLILAKAIEQAGFDLVVCGMASTDATMGVVPAMLAERLGVPQVTVLDEVAVEGGVVKGRREGDTATEQVEASLPAVISVTDRTGEARFPSFKGIMAAKKKPLEEKDLDDLGVDADLVGLSAAWSVVDAATARPPRSKGEVVTDEGEGGVRLAGFLAARKFI
ncbi:electron transfer flavoprotein subunit beta/FixA family protein [Yinghuangia sp. ASG 101]|uniref:electron transfer flavoprotein subunit beta/FixA family protein n=1 Tax=Yinghuangia sp. ASG 101 TaxID=2896848 RepID=UPI001E3FA632|nr:electron transfer flavoprotein subunit beta/FixA family protein [Yinghuangia sp. ASG 101]UGQ11215.1 electron transfer flavoprotein subunit beta/FixA family protein [Yinghuangia sp. ASG 101]UGQ13287.1 electron transfer flavoprotein subunit beta/FixA family protein [Yinghuangia sp. ASG 101]